MPIQNDPARVPQRTDGALRLDEVAVRYTAEVVGLHPVSLTFAPNEITVLLGRSGAGKSTLLRTLNHLTVPTSGIVTVPDQGVLRAGERLRAHRRRTAMIFQQHQLIARYTALQNVMMGRLGRYPSWRTLFPMPAGDREFGLECLERVGLLHKALTRTSHLSGGEQQRVGIARALAQQPRLILADEPVASLDPATAATVLDHLRAIAREEGIPAIVSLHQIDLALSFADRIVGLSKGHVVFDGAPSALTDDHLTRIYDDLPRGARTRPAKPAGSPLPTDTPTRMEAIG